MLDTGSQLDLVRHKDWLSDIDYSPAAQMSVGQGYQPHTCPMPHGAWGMGHGADYKWGCPTKKTPLGHQNEKSIYLQF